MNKTFLIVIILVLGIKAGAQTPALVADSLYARGNYAKAIKYYQNADPTVESILKIAKAYDALGNYKLALDYFQKGVELYPDDDLLLYQYALLLKKTKKWQEALDTFNELIKRDSLNPNYHYQQGLTRESLIDTLAQKSFKKAFELDSTHQKAIYKIAKMYLQRKQHDSVLHYVDIGLSAYQENTELINLKALSYYWDMDYRKAIPYFETLLELGETSLHIYEKLSYSYDYISNREKAIEFQQIAVSINPKNADNIYILGKLYYENREYEKAEVEFKEALELMDEPLDSEYIQLALNYNRQRKYPESIETLKKALKENPTNDTAHFFLLNTKTAYYANLDTKIKLHEDFLEKFPKSSYVPFVKRLLSNLKEEKFMKGE